MKLSDNPARISFPRDDRSHLFFQSQPTAVRRGAAPVATLLLADDSMTTQKVVSLTFADEGIEVLTASDGDTAVKLYHERQPDIVLADVNIPGLNGYEICEEIRKTSDLATTPVVLLVGSFEPFDATEAHRVGANDYLTKPFSSIRRLVATVLAFLDDQPVTEAPHPPVDQEVQEISVEPPQDASAEMQPNGSAVPAVEYESGDVAPAAEPAVETAPVEDSEPSAEAMSDAWPEIDPDSPGVPTEPDFHTTNDIEELYSQSFAETIEMPRTVAEQVPFSDISSDDGLIEAQFTTNPAEDRPQEGVQQAEAEQAYQLPEQAADEEVSSVPAVEDQSAEEPQQIAHDLVTPTEETTPVGQDSEVLSSSAEQQTESTNGYSTWSEPPVAADYQQPETFEQRPHDAPTERLTPQNATTEKYDFDFRSEEAFFEPAPEPLTRSYEGLEPDSTFTNESERQSETADHVDREGEPPVASAGTPWETVAAPSDGGIEFDDRNLLEIPGHTVAADQRTQINPEQGLSMETVEHIARIVASQMSEQIIREIAERVVPMVVQQTLANKRDDSSN